MRFWEHLTPGKEREQAPILTAFIKRCRDYANAKAKERGYAILLSTRVPSSYDAARAFGFDPETWAREGLVDMIAIANFWAGADYDFDFAGWRARLRAANPAVTVLPCICDNVSCTGAPAQLDTAALAGWADNVYAEGADGIYTFNTAYYMDDTQRTLYEKGFTPDVARARTRRYLPFFHDCVPSGMSNAAQLPRALAKGCTVKIRVGTAAAEPCEVVLALNADVAAPAVTLNQQKPCGAPQREANLSRYGRDTKNLKVAWRIPFAAGTLRAGVNFVTLAAAPGPGRAMWCEIVVR